jgi:long-chain acyl-CoA synthetase
LWYQQTGRRWVPITWSNARNQVERLAAGFCALGVSVGERVGLGGKNSPEWVMVDYALQHAGAVVVPIYATSPPDQIRQILSTCRVRVVVAGDADMLGRVREAMVPGLETVVGLHLDEGGRSGVVGKGELLALGEGWTASNPTGLAQRLDSVERDGAATVIFTSGTGGEPKGAVLSHRNLIAAADGAARAVGVRPREVTLSYLPLAHAFERVVTTVVPLVATTERWTLWFVDEIGKLPAALRAVRPTIFVAVPLVWSRIESRIQAEVDASLGRLARLWLRAGRAVVGRRGPDRRPAGSTMVGVPVRLIGRRLVNRVGLGRCWFAVSGAAPLPAHTQEFFHALGVDLHQGWGLTETAALCTVQRPDDLEVGVVGAPLPGVEVRLASDGEVLVRGDNVFSGYEGEPELSARAFDQDGFFRTGDVGRWAQDGRLAIIDRIKDLIITAGGRKVAPLSLEAKLMNDPLISGAVVIGESRPYLIALISIDSSEAVRHASFEAGDERGLWERPEIRGRVEATIASVNRALSESEQVRRFAILPFGFPDDALTPTLKVKRRVVESTFSDLIEELYA